MLLCVWPMGQTSAQLTDHNTKETPPPSHANKFTNASNVGLHWTFAADLIDHKDHKMLCSRYALSPCTQTRHKVTCGASQFQAEASRRELLLLSGAAAAAATLASSAAAASEAAPLVPKGALTPELEISRVIKGCWQVCWLFTPQCSSLVCRRV